jgi:nicotinamidase/pyrazinamidase
MNSSDIIFWNVDTQFDFVSPDGKLYVPGAELLKPNWERLTLLAKKYSIRVVNTADWHYPESAELSMTPDFINTFPEHCMANTAGAEFIEETTPENSFILDWDGKNIPDKQQIVDVNVRNFTIRKDAFDVFKGNRFTDDLLKQISPETVIVYGVTTNVCVNDAVVGLAARVPKVLVVKDAIKELPNIPLPFENWEKLGVGLIYLSKVEEILLTRS